MPSSTRLRRDLLLALGVLFAGAILLAALGLLLLLPVFASPAEALAFVVVLLVADLMVLFLFTRDLLRRRLLQPVEELVRDVHRIAGGKVGHRVRSMPNAELESVAASVNAMADRLVTEQEALAENVVSLERTNEELVEARDQVIQAARLASVGTLAAGVAHEVGNPLGAILVYVDVARGRAEEGSEEAELLLSIRREAERIDNIVRGLLDYARPRDTEPAPMEVVPVLHRVRELLEGQGRLSDLEHIWDLGGDDVPLVLLEPHRLEQVLVNLLLNAVHALRECDAPQVRIALKGEPGALTRLPTRRDDDPPGINYRHRRRVSGDRRREGPDTLFTASRLAVIRVEDNGPGIADEHLPHIFDPFFTTKEPGEGTGLGLAICARLVEGMGGRIEAENRPGGGAAFTIRLPGARAPASADQSESTAGPPSGDTGQLLGGRA